MRRCFATAGALIGAGQLRAEATLPRATASKRPRRPKAAAGPRAGDNSVAELAASAERVSKRRLRPLVTTGSSAMDAMEADFQAAADARRAAAKVLSPLALDFRGDAIRLDESRQLPQSTRDAVERVVRDALDPSKLLDTGHASRRKHELDSLARPKSLRPKRESLTTRVAQLPLDRFEAPFLTEESNADKYRELETVREEEHYDEKQTHAPSTATSARDFETSLRHALMRYYSLYPVNTLITSENVVIMAVQDKTTGEEIRLPPPQEPITSAQAREVAEAHDLDLVQVGVMQSRSRSEPETVLCVLTDHLGAVMDELQWTAQESLDKPRDNFETLEVGFRGGTDAHAIWFKTREVARMLKKGHPVLLSLAEFGTPREGFPVMDTILAAMQAECRKYGSVYAVGKVRYDNGSLKALVMPSTHKTPLTTSKHPSQKELAEGLSDALYDEQYDREVTVHNDGMHFKDKQGLYMYPDAFNWALRGGGLSLRSQRKLKITQGWLPKGEKIYKLRGDVNDREWRTLSQTTAESIGSPAESNIDQARRAATVLTLRHNLRISDMHDQQETEGNTSTIATAHYRTEGNALDVGALKEDLGLKTNRVKLPRKASGFATMGMAEPSGDTYNFRRDEARRGPTGKV